MNSFQLHELETAVALVLLSPRLRVSQTAGRSGHRTRQESRERDAPPGTAVSRLGDESATSYTKEW